MSAPDPETNQRWMPVARLLRPQGRRGEILAEPLTDLEAVFQSGQQFRLAPGSGTPALNRSTVSPSPVTLEDSWRPQGRNAGRIVLKLKGVDSITEAETLQGREILFPEASLPTLDEDTYLVRDLVGCAVFDGTQLLGTVTELQFPVGPDGRTRLPDAADLLVIQLADAPDADPVLIPFVKAWLSSLDLSAKRIVMNLPPGLLDNGEDLHEPEQAEEPESTDDTEA